MKTQTETVSVVLAACENLLEAQSAMVTVSDNLPGQKRRDLDAAKAQARAAIAKAKV